MNNNIDINKTQNYINDIKDTDKRSEVATNSISMLEYLSNFTINEKIKCYDILKNNNMLEFLFLMNV